MRKVTVDQLIADLKEVSDMGYGHARIHIEEVGEGYFGDLLYVDTLMTGEDPSLLLVGERTGE